MKTKKAVSLLFLSLFLASCNGVNSSTQPNSSSSSQPNSQESSVNHASSNTPASSNPASSDASSSESTSSSTVVVTEYTISAAEDIVGGSLSFSKTKAAKGETVEVTVTALEGYRFNSIAAEGITFTAVEGKENVYSFVMVENNVVVSATFDKVYHASLESLDWQKKFIKGVSLSSLDYIKGEEITLTISAGDSLYNGFSSFNIKYVYVHVGDKVIHPSLKDGETSSKSLEVKLTMEEGDSEIVVVYNSQNTLAGDGETGYKVTYTTDGSAKAYGYDPSESYTYAAVVVKRTPGVKVKSTYTLAGSTEAKEVTYDKSSTATLGGNEFSMNIATMRSSIRLTADINFDFKADSTVTTHKITYANDDLVSVSKDDLPTTFITGETVYFEYSAKTEGKYALAATITGVETIATNDGSKIQFVMPDSDVTISFNIADALKVTFDNNPLVSEHPTDGLIVYDNGNTYVKPGEKISWQVDKFKLTDANKHLVALQVNGEVVNTVEKGSSYWSYVVFEFTMPESGDVNIKYGIVDYYSIEVPEEYTSSSSKEYLNVSSSMSSKDGYRSGKDIEMTYRVPNSMHYLDSVEIKKKDDNSVISETVLPRNIDTAAKTVTFKMPAYSIIVTPTFKVKEGYSLDITIPEGYESVVGTGSKVTGTTSGVVKSFPSTDTVDDFEKDEELSVSLSLTTNKYTPALILNGDTENPIAATSSPSIFGNSVTYTFSKAFKITKDSTLTFQFTEKQAITVHVENTQNITGITYSVNGGTAVDSLPDLYGGETLKVNLPDAPEGKIYSVEYTDKDGKTITPGWTGKVDVSDGMTIKIVVTDGYKISISGLSSYYGDYFTVKRNGTELKDGDTIQLGETIVISNGDSFGYGTLTIKNGTDTISKDLSDSGKLDADITITVKGTVKITFEDSYWGY